MKALRLAHTIRFRPVLLVALLLLLANLLIPSVGAAQIPPSQSSRRGTDPSLDRAALAPPTPTPTRSATPVPNTSQKAPMQTGPLALPTPGPVLESQKAPLPTKSQANGPAQPSHQVIPGPLAPVSKTASSPVNPTVSTPGWSTLMYEGFEGAWPSGSWSVLGNPTWDDDDYKPYVGAWSAWCANGGTGALDPATSDYPNNMNAWTIYGPFNLSSYTNAHLQFSYWNQSESGFDYFNWLASVDGTNFYGYQVSGDSGGWQSQTFDLTNVYSLGNLAGRSSVWIAFVFTSDSVVTAKGAFVDEVLLEASTQPNLTAYTPSGWDNPIVPANVTGGHSTTSLRSDQNTYIDWAITNYGGSTSTTFTSCLYFDNSAIQCWNSNGLSQNYYAYVEDWTLNLTPAPGWHTLKIVADVNSQVSESNESDNAWEASYYWDGPAQPNLTAFTPSGWDYPIVPSSVTGTNTVNTLYTTNTYIDWAVVNNGTGISTPFVICLYFDNSQIQCWNINGLNQDYYVYLTDWILNLSPSPGSHTLKIVADVNNQISESNESDNAWERSFYWQDGCPPSSYAPSLDGALPLTLAGDALPPLDRGRKGGQVPNLSASLPTNLPGHYDTSVFMAGTVAVGIVFPESSGSMENWSTGRLNCAVQKIQTGLEWWRSHSPGGANLTFSYDIHLSVPTSYEPIDRPMSEAGLWIGEVMTNMGYSGSDYFEQVYNYVNAIRTSKQANWGYAIFVADSLNDPDGNFKNGPYSAYAYLGGPFQVLTYDNDGWGIGNMNWVAAHETGHIFMAADQYYQAGYGGCTSTTSRYGYLGIANSNCQYQNPNSVPSIMRSNENVYETSAAGQIGLRDSDTDSLPDPRDTAPSFILTPHSPDPTTEKSFSYTGYVLDQPWPHAQCTVSGDSCFYRDLTINTITSTQYRIDGGNWFDVTPMDGALNSDDEQITFSTGTLNPGVHTIEVRAMNSVGNWAPVWSDSVTVLMQPPSNLNATAISSTQINLSWSATADGAGYIDGYRIYRNGSALTTVGATTLTYSDTSATCNTSFSYTVKAFKGSNESNPSNTATRTAFACVPTLNLPANAASFARSATISLSWNSAGAGIQYYAEFWGGPSLNLNSGWVSGTSWSIGSQWGGSYQWRVKAKNASGESGWSETRSLTIQYGSPTNLNATGVSASQINLTWGASADAPGNIDGYRIYRNGTAINTVGASATSYNDTGLPNCETTYNYVVKAYKGGTESDPAAASANTGTCPQPDLIVESITYSPSTPVAGQTVNYTVRIKNQGAAPAESSFGVHLYLDHAPTGCSDFSTPGTNWSMDGLAANTSHDLAYAGLAMAAGTHQLHAFVDSGCSNTEANEGNNTKGPIAITIAKANTTATLASSPNASVFGQSITLTATVAVAAPGSGMPTGSVSFREGASILGAGTLSGGVATFTTSALARGSHSITAVYGGDTNSNSGTSSALTQVVNRADTVTALSSSAGSSVAGQSILFTATVDVLTPGNGTATGTVSFKDGATTLGTGVLAGGTATLSTAALLPGSHNVTAVYQGDTSFNTSSSSGIGQVVYKADTTTSLSSSVNPSVAGQSVTFTAHVTVVAPGTGTPTGTVTFKEGITDLGTATLSGGTGTFTTSLLTPGDHALTVVYEGASTFNTSASSPATLTVNKASTATVLSSSANPSTFGKPITLTAIVTVLAPGAGTPTGTVEFREGTTTYGTSAVSNGKATLLVPALPLGTHPIVAVYSGDSHRTGSLSPALTQEVNENYPTFLPNIIK